MHPTRPTWFLAAGLVIVMVLAGCRADEPEAEVTVLAEGLLNPIGLAALPDGTILVAEEGTGNDDTSAGVSIVSSDGSVRRVVSDLPSGRDSGDLSGVPLVGVSPDGTTVYLAHFGLGHLWTIPVRQVVESKTAAGPDDLLPAMLALNRVTLVNPFDITFDEEGAPVVTDASGNGLAIETPDGTTRFIHRFGAMRDPRNPSIEVEAVPTGIARVGGEYFVTLTGGCPYPSGVGRLVAVDEARNERTVAEGLDMPIDVTVGPDGSVWVLEFARFEEGASCFTGEGYLPETGRLSRLADDGDLETVVEGLDFPGAVLARPDGTLVVSEVFTGRVVEVSVDSPGVAGPPSTPASSGNGDETAPRFTDVAGDVGLSFRHGVRSPVPDDPVAAMGGGLCWIDYDDDGWQDLYLVNSHALVDAPTSDLPANALFRNDRGRFVDVTDRTKTGLALRGNGCVAADLDRDGFTDLFVTADGPDKLLRNLGDGTFEEIAAEAGVDAAEWNSAAAVGDVDGDGWPDLYVASYLDLDVFVEKPSGAFPQDHPGLVDHLYLNQGAGPLRFVDGAVEAGLSREDRGLGALFTDVDEDGDLDLYVANDGQANRLYRNDSPGPGESLFTDVTAEAGVGDPGSGMGVAGGDFDGDTMEDLFVTNWEAELHALYRNTSTPDGDPGFQYSTYRIGLAGLGGGDTGWGTTWTDVDHDTDLDLLVVHGRVPVTDLDGDPEQVRLYRNLLAEGSPGMFRDWSAATGLQELGPVLGRGSAAADYDNDGDIDVAINVIAGSAILLQSDGAAGNWIEIDPGAALPGTTATVETSDGVRMVRRTHAGSSYLASEDPRLHFGLGSADRVARVEVHPPGSPPTVWEDVAADQLLVVEGLEP